MSDEIYSHTPSFTHSDLVLLVNWMADNGWSVESIVYAVEKPWKYSDELEKAKADLAEELAREQARKVVPS